MVVMMMVVVWVEMIVLLEVVMKIQDVVAVLAWCGQLTNSGF